MLHVTWAGRFDSYIYEPIPPAALYPYTAEKRDKLGDASPKDQEISQEQGFCTPRPERLPEGNLEVLSDLNLLSKLVSDHFTDQKNLYEACPWPFWNRLPNVSNLLFDDFPISISQRRSWDCVFWDSGP